MRTDSPLPPASGPTRSADQPIGADDRDAWLEDVRRWYYGGMEPSGDKAADPSRDSPVGPVEQDEGRACAFEDVSI